MSIVVYVLFVLLIHQHISLALSPHSSSPDSRDENGIDLSLRLGPAPIRKKAESREVVQKNISPAHQSNIGNRQKMHPKPEEFKLKNAQYQKEYRIMLKKIDKERLQGYDKRKNDRTREKFEKFDEKTKAKIKLHKNQMNRQSYHLRKLRLGKYSNRSKFILQLQQKAADQTATPEEMEMIQQINKATQRSKAKKGSDD